VQKAAAARQLDLVAQVALDPKQPAFDRAAETIAKAGPQALILCTAGSTFTGALKALSATPARPAVYGFSVVSVDQVNKELGSASRGIVLAQIMPSLANGANPAVSEYLALVRAKGGNAKPTTTQFEGFMHARVLVEGLKRAGRNLTTETLVQALESGSEIAFGKFAVRYTPQAHSGSSYVELAIVDADGRLRY
jgi:ABC-type branched-subunit amino acid transport system substrate-binding protein